MITTEHTMYDAEKWLEDGSLVPIGTYTITEYDDEDDTPDEGGV